MSLLDVDGLSIRYGENAVVDGLTFSVNRGEAVGIVGESGSGKTQTALALLGLLPESARVAGTIRLGDEALLDAGRFLDERRFDALRSRRIAMVFQDPALALNPYVRIGAQLERILRCHELADRNGARRKVIDALGRVGLPDPERQARAYAHQLSGGMRQRAMIAAALIAEPELLVADEPTTALDVTVQAQVLDLLGELRDDTALVLITHDLGVVAGHCERTLVMERGRLVEQGPTRDVFGKPLSAHTKALLEAQPRIDAEVDLKPATGPIVLDVDSLGVDYHEPGHGLLNAVIDVDLGVKEGETVAIVGESGSGKSSLVRAALGLVAPASGRIVFEGSTLAPTTRKRPTGVLRDLQMVFQDPAGSLDPQMRVADIVAEPLRVHEPALGDADRRDRVSAVLERVGLDTSFGTRFPHQLSGGQAQRVAIARALVPAPRVLVCDEAVAALDGTVRRQILELLRAEQRRTGLAILFIAHDLGVVREICHRVLVMYLGRVVEVAPNEAIFRSPEHPYTQALLAAIPVAQPAATSARAAAPGEAASILSPPSGCSFHPRCRYANAECRTRVPALERAGESLVACIHAGHLDATAKPATGEFKNR